MGKWLDKDGLIDLKTRIKTKVDTKVDKYTEESAGKFLQTDSNGNAVWGTAASPSAVAEATEQWLDDHVSGGSTIAVDDSLTVEGAAADAKATGALVKSAATQPTDSTNRLWINESSETEYQVPTYGEFSDLKSALEDDTEVQIIDFIKGKYIVTSGETVDITDIRTNVKLMYAVVDCQPNDVFYVTGKGGNDPRLWCFIDSSGNSLGAEDAQAGATNLKLVAPASASKLIINRLLQQYTSVVEHPCYKGTPAYMRLDKLETVSDAVYNTGLVSNETAYIHDGYIVIATDKWTESNLFKHMIVPVNPGQIVVVEATDDNLTIVAFLKTYNISDGENADLSSVIAEPVPINLKTSYSAVVPSDTAYLYVAIQASNGTRVPKSCIIDNYDVMKKAIINISEVNNDGNAYRVYGERFLNNYINPDTGKWTINTGYKHSIIPVSGGETYEIRALNGVVAFLRSYQVTGNESADFSQATGYTSYIRVTYMDSIKGTIPNDVKYVYIIRYVGATDRTPYYASINGHVVYPSENDARTALTESGGNHLRIMMFNVGRFTNGASGQDTPSEDCPQIIQNYKQFLCRYRPDMIGLAEFKNSMDAGGTYEANEQIFDFVYPYTVSPASPNNGRVLKSKIKMLSQRAYSITYHDETTENDVTTYYVLGRFLVCGKVIAVISAHYPWQSDALRVRARIYILEQMINQLENEEYAVIIADFNTNGDNDSVTSLDEAQSFNTYLHSVDWEACNGEYLGWNITYPKTNAYLDNIFYKNNGKITFANFEVITDQYPEGNPGLASDHYPVYADFVIT